MLICVNCFNRKNGFVEQLYSVKTAVVINHKWCNHPLGETMRHMLPWLNDKRKLCLVTLLWEPKGKKGKVSDPATPHGGSVGQNSRSIDIRKTISGPTKYSIPFCSQISHQIPQDTFLYCMIIFTTCSNAGGTDLNIHRCLVKYYSYLTCECSQSLQGWQFPQVSSSQSGTSRLPLDEGRNFCSPGTGSSGKWVRWLHQPPHLVATWGWSPGPSDSLIG